MERPPIRDEGSAGFDSGHAYWSFGTRKTKDLGLQPRKRRGAGALQNKRKNGMDQQCQSGVNSRETMESGDR